VLLQGREHELKAALSHQLAKFVLVMRLIITMSCVNY
jgi:hypothetical protein